MRSVEKGKEAVSTKRTLLRFVIKITVIAAVLWLLQHFVLGIYVCHTNDMFPAVKDGDLIITFRLSACERNDIIAYEYDKIRYFGRIVALPGDVVDIDGTGGYLINGLPSYEKVFYPTMLPENSPLAYPYTVQEGEVFVLSDLRGNLHDSREFGPVSLHDIDGSIILLLRRRGW